MDLRGVRACLIARGGALSKRNRVSGVVERALLDHRGGDLAQLLRTSRDLTNIERGGGVEARHVAGGDVGLCGDYTLAKHINLGCIAADGTGDINGLSRLQVSCDENKGA